MIASKRNTASIYDGCLSYLKADLDAKLPKGQKLTDIGINGIIGSEEYHNVYNDQFDVPQHILTFLLVKNIFFQQHIH